MSRIAILSDIHGNLPAFEAVLRDLVDSGAEGIAFGGDIVGYGASPGECVSIVRGLGGHCVLGNHDYYTRIVDALGATALGMDPSSGAVAGVTHALRTMDQEALGWLRERPLLLPVEGAVVAHSELSEPVNWHYLHRQEDAIPTLDILRESEIGLGFFGHTHRQDYFFCPDAFEAPEDLGGGRILVPEDSICAVTVGSVGQPRDGGDVRAGWVLWDSDERIVEFRRTEYPVWEAAKAILEAGLPQQSAFRLLDDEALETLFRSVQDS